MSPEKTARKIALLLTFAGLFTIRAVHGGEYEGGYQVVDLVAPLSDRASVCPEVPIGQWENGIACLTSGVIDRILLEQGVQGARITVSLNGDRFYYLLNNSLAEAGAPMALFTASRLNRIPVTLRFRNWGGAFYITEAAF